MGLRVIKLNYTKAKRNAKSVNGRSPYTAVALESTTTPTVIPDEDPPPMAPTNPVPRIYKKGDTLKWETDEGYVNVELIPKCLFSPTNLFSTDPDFCKKHRIKPGRPVRIKEGGAPFRYWCGFVEIDEEGKKTTIGYPVTRDIGVEDPGH